MAMFGTTNLGRKWAPRLVISGVEAPSEQFVLDPALPTLGRDPYIPNNDYIVIPRGRFLGIKNPQTASAAAYAQVGRPVLTLANGSEGLSSSGISTDIKALGFSETQYFRQFEQKVQPFPQLSKLKLISLPYIQASNGAYGALKPGDKVTAYYGTANGSPVNPQEVGKAVKWVPRTLYSKNQAASTTVNLTSAIYPAFQPRIVMAWNAGTVVTLTSATYTYDTVNNYWKATVSGAVTDVLYTAGQLEDNIAGVVSSFEAVGTAGGQLTSPHKFQGWLEWVHDNFGQWAFPPLVTPRPFSTSTNETPTQLTTNTWKLANFPIVPIQPITVTVSGTRVDPLTGISTTLTNYVLPLADNTYFQDWTLGADYMINPVTGILTIDEDITVSSVTVTYEYETTYLDGKIYDYGVQGLTDGIYSGVRGTPANLELYGVVADMHIMTI